MFFLADCIVLMIKYLVIPIIQTLIWIVFFMSFAGLTVNLHSTYVPDLIIPTNLNNNIMAVTWVIVLLLTATVIAKIMRAVTTYIRLMLQSNFP